jgi:outer membrane protein TolC
MRERKKSVVRHSYSAASLALVALGLPGTVLAQVPQPPPTETAPGPPVKTPPTPLPREIPATEPYGVKPSDVRPTNTFEKAIPGQPLPGDPAVIRTLDEALAVALQRNPSLLLAEERAYRTTRVVRQILATNGPQITVSGSYSRLSGSGAAFGGGGGGISPGQIQNPFSPGLSITPPGAVPVALSGGVNFGGSAGAAGAGTTGGNATAGGTAAATRAASTRQADDDDDNDTGGNQPQQGGNTFGGGTNLNQYAVRGSITQLIDITGIVRAAVQVGRLEEALTRLEIVRLRMETTLAVKNAYYNLLRSQAFVAVNEAAVTQSEELLRVTVAQREAGVAAEFDVLRARTQLANNQQALISARNQVLVSKNALANTLGIDPATPIDPLAPAIPPLPGLNEEELLAQAIKQRPEYAQADINILKAQKNIRLARRSLEPFLNASANGSYNPSPALVANQKATGSFGVVLTLPLSDGGSTKAAVEAARSDERGALVQKDQFTRGIKAEVQQAVVAVKDAEERTRATEQTEAQAREALRLAGVRFRAGVGTQLDVNDAQTALVQASTNAVNARYDYLGALARLTRAVGSQQ